MGVFRKAFDKTAIVVYDGTSVEKEKFTRRSFGVAFLFWESLVLFTREELNLPNRVAHVVIGPSIGYVPLTQGQYALVDAYDVPALAPHKWMAQYQEAGGYYAVRYGRQIKGKRERISMHRALRWAPDNECVDHKNGNSLDNRLCNLRRATKAQNCQNSKTPRNNTSGFKGVTKLTYASGIVRFTAQIKGTYLGTFDTPEEAHAAYVAKATELFGEFARAA